MQLYIYRIIIIIIIILILFIIQIYFGNWFAHQRNCNDIYNQTPIYTKHKILRGFLTKEQCKLIIQEAGLYGEKRGWTTERHDNYPTTDNEITKEWSCYSFLKNKIESQLYLEYVKLFKINKDKLKIDEIFIAKYDGNNYKAQNSLDEHTDGSEFSFIIALNDDYTGGGTNFKKKKQNIKLSAGDVVVFCGQTIHAGLPVTNGVRYIIPGFLSYGKCLQQFVM